MTTTKARLPNPPETSTHSPDATPQGALAEQFEDLAQQHDAARLGMWLFLATEILFFGGLFMAYIVYRWRFSEPFDLASNHLHVGLGTINTLILLGSSFTMAMAVHANQHGRRGLLAALLFVTALLGAVFLAIKLYEWHLEAVDHLVPGQHFSFEGPAPSRAEIFFWLYFGMTGLHALHLSIGVLLMLVLAAWSLRATFTRKHPVTVEIAGLYWHYIDIVWLFLYPLLYLGGRHLGP